MKFILALLITSILLGVPPISAQVGINTVDPQADLDINGDLRVQEVLTDNTLTSVLVLESNGLVKKNTNLLNDLRDQVSSKTVSFVAGTGASSISLLDINLLSGWYKISFSNEEIDENNDYNNTTFEFKAPRTGVYDMYAQFEVSSLLTAGTIGVGIFKRAAAATEFELVAQESYLNISVLTINVSPPVRKIQKLLKLNAGDIIIFGAQVPLLSLTLLGGNRSFFSIFQLK